MNKKKDELKLKLWKSRQTAEGHDVSKVSTLEEAAHFFDKKAKKAATPKVKKEG